MSTRRVFFHRRYHTYDFTGRLIVRLKLTLVTGIFAWISVLAPSICSAEVQRQEFRVVGTWSYLDHWKKREEPFWRERIPSLSDGKLTAKVKSLTDLGISGFEIMRLLKKGTYDVVHGMTNYVAQDSPVIEGVDLAGVAQDLPTFIKVNNVYREILAKEFRKKYQAKLLMLYGWPSLQLWCNFGHRNPSAFSLKTFKGKKIRALSLTIGDFIEGIGAQAVIIPYAGIIPALKQGTADCGITGTVPAYRDKWWQIITHNIRIRLGYASSFMAMNSKVWDGLNTESQDLLLNAMPNFEAEMWQATKFNDQRFSDCNVGKPCRNEGGVEHPRDAMAVVELSTADQAKIKTVVEKIVLKRWAQRCGTQRCIDDWNSTIGKIQGMTARR